MKEDLSERSSSHVDENDEGTVIENKARENLEEEEEKNSVGESLLKVESILMEIDKELGNNGDENGGLKDSLSSLSDDPKDDSDKKSFRY